MFASPVKNPPWFAIGFMFRFGVEFGLFVLNSMFEFEGGGCWGGIPLGVDRFREKSPCWSCREIGLN